jgi:hypothetical protein
MDEGNVAYTQNRILFTLKREKRVICNNMTGTGDHYAKVQ